MQDMDRLISKKDVCRIFNVSRATVDRRARDPHFPKRRVISCNRHGRPARVGYRFSEVKAYYDQLPVSTPAWPTEPDNDNPRDEDDSESLAVG